MSITGIQASAPEYVYKTLGNMRKNRDLSVEQAQSMIEDAAFLGSIKVEMAPEQAG